jgi:hypothetical protein
MATICHLCQICETCRCAEQSPLQAVTQSLSCMLSDSSSNVPGGKAADDADLTVHLKHLMYLAHVLALSSACWDYVQW